MSSTYFGLIAEAGEANIPLDRLSPKYFGLSYEEARRRAPAKLLPCRVFRLGGQKFPWLISAPDLVELIGRQRQKAAVLVRGVQSHLHSHAEELTCVTVSSMMVFQGLAS